MKTIVLAYHNIGCAGIEALLRNGFDIAAVFTHKDNLEEMWFDSVAELAASHNIPVYAPEDINHPLWVRKINDLAPEIIFSFYYRNLVQSPILDIPQNGCLNLHGSLLPQYRGRAPINWVLVNGETRTGVTLHYMTTRPDDGDIVSQTPIEIAEDDTAVSLHKKAAAAAGKMLDEVLPALRAGEAPRVPQDHANASYYGGRTPADGEIDWAMPAFKIRDLVRAVTRPFPGAFSHMGDRKCFFWAVSEVSGGEDAKPGAVLSVDPPVIACKTGALRIEAGQQEDDVFMGGAQLAAHMGLVEGMRFGKRASDRIQAARKKRVLILGVDGFIGNALSERLLESGRYEVHGMDLHSKYVQRLMGTPGFHFDWILKRTCGWCDTVTSTENGSSFHPLQKFTACAKIWILTRITPNWSWDPFACSDGSIPPVSSCWIG